MTLITNNSLNIQYFPQTFPFAIGTPLSFRLFKFIIQSSAELINKLVPNKVPVFRFDRIIVNVSLIIKRIQMQFSSSFPPVRHEITRSESKSNGQKNGRSQSGIIYGLSPTAHRSISNRELWYTTIYFPVYFPDRPLLTTSIDILGLKFKNNF